MTGQTVDIFAIRKVKAGVASAIAGKEALLPVALNADAEVVDLILLANRHHFIGAPCTVIGLLSPRPMGRVYHLIGRFRMTFQTILGNGLR